MDGENHYHPDCLQLKKDIDMIIEIWQSKINHNVIKQELIRVIEGIVFGKKIESGIILFGIKYYLKNDIPLHYPQGLYYVVQNQTMLNAFNEEKFSEFSKPQIKISLKEDPLEGGYLYKPFKTKELGDIF